ncbi:GH17200 [Drosophila grimshawi]|uniref:GH17200 n=1 Tax=Drosophila grimshawi TaxID=7222 RepID=B4J1U6_DROGR|nr:GH17200 [Drosophila grimshawi]
MPIGDWLFPYLLLQPNNTEVEFDNQPHIRVAYVRGNPKLRDYALNEIGGNMLFGSIFSNTANDFLLEYLYTKPHESHYGEAFHIYTVIKHRDRIIFKVDGVTYGTITDKMIIDDINKNEHYIVIGLTAGGTINFRDEYFAYPDNIDFKMSNPKAPVLFFEDISGNSTKWEHPKLVIDYVRVYTTHPDEN